MPESLNTQQQIWVTLPQALRWIMAGEMPTLENREALPTCPSAHTSRADLFSFWIDGRLKLYGLDGYDPNRPWTPLKSSLTYEYDCWKGTDLAWISPQVIKQANFDSIDWEHGTLGRFHLLKHEDDSHPYFIDLRVRWNDLAKLTLGGEQPNSARGIAEPPSNTIEPNQSNSNNELADGLKTSEFTDLKKQTLQRRIEISSEQDGEVMPILPPSSSTIFDTKLLRVLDAVREKISSDPTREKRPWTQSSIANIAKRIDPSLTQTELSNISRVLTDDRLRGKL